MLKEQGGVMSIKEMEKAGIPLPEHEEGEIEADGRKIPYVKQEPASNVGIYNQDSEKVDVIEMPKKNSQEELKKAA